MQSQMHFLFFMAEFSDAKGTIQLKMSVMFMTT